MAAHSIPVCGRFCFGSVAVFFFLVLGLCFLATRQPRRRVSEPYHACFLRTKRPNNAVLHNKYAQEIIFDDFIASLVI